VNENRLKGKQMKRKNNEDANSPFVCSLPEETVQSAPKCMLGECQGVLHENFHLQQVLQSTKPLHGLQAVPIHSISKLNKTKNS
jgi:hypothetical protein